MSVETRSLDVLPPELLYTILRELSGSLDDLAAAICAHRAFRGAAANFPIWELVASLRWHWRVRVRTGEAALDYCIRCVDAARRHRLVFVGGCTPFLAAANTVHFWKPCGKLPIDCGHRQLVHPHTPTLYEAPAAASSGKYLYMAGGLDDEEEPTNTACQLGPASLTPLPHLPRGLCFGALDVDADDRRLWLAGGGSSVYRGAQVFDHVHLLMLPHPERPPPLLPVTWGVVGRLRSPRCGHALAADCRTTLLYSVGGYGGGALYHDTIESFDTQTGEALAIGARMAAARSGAGARWLLIASDSIVFLLIASDCLGRRCGLRSRRMPVRRGRLRQRLAHARVVRAVRPAQRPVASPPAAACSPRLPRSRLWARRSALRRGWLSGGRRLWHGLHRLPRLRPSRQRVAG